MPAFTLPIAPLRKPSCLNGQSNGELKAGILKKCGIGNFLLVDPAARACRALVAAAEAAGFKVRATGTYRTLKQQEQLFLSRYTTKELKGRPTKKWNGVTYWQLPKTAMAATPGTSNHGWGLAVDFAEELNGKPGVESVSPRFVKWMIKHAKSYGFSAELQSEPWHWRYVDGNKIPAAVLAFENNQGVTAPAPVVEKPVAPAPIAPVPARDLTVVVVKGDSWWKLAAKHMGSGLKWPQLKKHNPKVTLRPGVTVRIPAK